ncbi:MAG: FAD-dependent oxidoreductase [Gammaproteobacteria bacterium]|nr:FAD-dependent oxidoreductase [Gammaproteobacteria bacterium]MDH3465171.1 FAD-dependent oxidoreductase [Gammaproteobacteria bacterium]
MKIAIIGTGIAGNIVARALHRDHDITVFEANDYVGGHTHTHDIELHGNHYAVDTGFIVFNHRTYPNFVQLLRELSVAEQTSEMSFSVKCEGTGLEYNGTTLNTLFAQRKNLVSIRFHNMLRDILRFNREAPSLLLRDDDTLTLGQYLGQEHYRQTFIDQYLVPMGAAIWSTDPGRMLDFPAQYFVRFLNNHGMLTVNDRPQWRVIKGGSNSYIERLIDPFRRRIRLRTPVVGLRRLPDRVIVEVANGESEYFDYAFVATHSDQALRLLADPSPLEREVLGAIPYQMNDAVLHTDASVLPRKRLAWAAWNYHIPRDDEAHVSLTYNMNILQGLNAPEAFCVTLNDNGRIDPDRVIKRLRYAHPIYTRDGVAAQDRQIAINGAHRTYYCGAYWRYGFHEDGVVSAHNALQHFQENSVDAQLPLRRAS